MVRVPPGDLPENALRNKKPDRARHLEMSV
jgi:hypothetical protein